MFEKLLRTTMDSGNEMIVSLKGHTCDTFQGRILDVADDHFTMFHSGPNGGILWVFKIEDIHYCGMVVDLPASLATLLPSGCNTLQHRAPDADTAPVQELEE